MYAYAFEYKSMFGTLFQRERYNDKIKVASIGCGNMIDYWGLVEAREGDALLFINRNAATTFTKANSLVSDVYVFPKSISEFSNEEFQEICEGFSKKQIQKDKVHVLISLRSDPGSMERDMERSKKIVLAMKQNGFVTENRATTYIHYVDEDRGIKKIDYKFEYPNEAIELLASLNTACNTYANEGENCTDDCLNLNRWPVLKARNIRYQILSFDRKDSL